MPEDVTWIRIPRCTCGAWGLPPGPHEGDCGWVEADEARLYEDGAA